MSYANRHDAGKQLAKALRRIKHEDPVILALPRGGVVLGAEVAKEFKSPLGLVLAKKISHPFYPEYAIGAIAEGEKAIYNETEVTSIDESWLAQAESSARELIKRRYDMYYDNGFTPPQVNGKTIIIVDDGIATGLTMEASVRAMRAQRAKRIIVAVPIAANDSASKLEELADEVIILENPKHFQGSVGSHYQEFEQVDDKEVISLLREANHNV